MGENRNKGIILHSNYTVKQVHKKFNGDKTIYERDYAVLNGVGPWSAGSIENGTPTFKMVRRVVPNATKKHEYGTWLTQDTCGDESEIWTLGCLKNAKTSGRENKITLNPNYNSLLNFAYYGSCKELVEKSISNIIKVYPGELYFTNETFTASNGGVYFIVDNPMGIDIMANSDVNNDLSHFTKSYKLYNVIDGSDEIACQEMVGCEEERFIERIMCAGEGDIITKLTLTYKNNEENETINLYTSIKNGEIIILCDENNNGLRIRPIESEIEKVFEGLSDFEKVMLNTDTNPRYTMRLDFPHETENGIETYKKKFTWPTINGWNLNISGGEFKSYFNDLMDLCDFYDERCTDNLWRIMTHDSIKNMDNAVKSNDSDDYEIGNTQLRKALTLYSTLFDDLKRYTDNIKQVNNVSYDSNENTPDYFLSDKLELAGWEVFPTSPSIDENNKIGDLYRGMVKKYSSSDANVEFMKRLLLNSKAILSHKGTKYGIEMLLGLFGLVSKNSDSENFDYTIDEYVSVVKRGVETPVLESAKLNIERYNKWKKSYEGEIGSEIYGIEDTLQGLPIRMVTYTNTDENGVEHTYKYVIPWFDKLQVVDGNPYFQMYGGWCKIPKRSIKNKYAPTVKNIITNNIDSVYEETIKNIKVVRKISDLTKMSQSTLIKNTVYYVYDIENFDSIFGDDNITLNGGENKKKASNYFMLVKPEYYYNLQGENRGWENIPIEDIESGEGDGGFRVLYLDSIIDDSKGNNPHGGIYDDGREYLEYFKTLFKHTIANDGFTDMAFNCESGEIEDDIKTCGFALDDYVIDNVKTWFYSDTSAPNDMYLVRQNDRCEYETIKDDENNEIHNGYVRVGAENTNTFFNSMVNPYNFEGGEKYDEAAANSLINIKNLTIDFNGGCADYEEFYDYFIKSILPYLKQMIPSTSIVNIKVKNATVTRGNKKAPLIIDNVEK